MGSMLVCEVLMNTAHMIFRHPSVIVVVMSCDGSMGAGWMKMELWAGLVVPDMVGVANMVWKNEWWLCRLLFVAEMTRHKNDAKRTGCGLKWCRYR